MTLEGVDRSRLEQDVRRLLFADCKDTTTWDHLGNLDPVKRPTSKHVQLDTEHIDIVDDQLECVVLPPALAMMYEAGQEHFDGKGADSALLYCLDLVAQPPPNFDVHDRLYAQAVTTREKIKKDKEERLRLEREEEDRQCTFRPTVSDSAKKLASKAKSELGYYGECLEWRRQAEKKLRKKVEKEEKEKWEDTMVPWKMGDRSKLLVKRMKKRARSQAKNKDTPAHKGIVTPRQHRRAAVDEAQPTFTPVTNTAARLQMLLGGGDTTTGNVTVGSFDENTMQESFARHERATTVVSNLQQRLEQDIEERRLRQEERAEQFKARQNEKLYDKVTGQPLFVPNAMPVIRTRDGKERKFVELSKAEQQEYIKRWKSIDIDFIPAIARKSQERPQRDMDDIVKHMWAQATTSNQRLAKKRRKAKEEEFQECIFKPSIDRKSAEIASQRSQEKGHEKLTKLQLIRQGKLKVDQESDNSWKPKKITKQAVTQLIQRQEQFKNEKERHRAKSRVSIEREDLEECTFKPKLNRHSEAMVQNAEARMASQSAPVPDFSPKPEPQQPQTERSRSMMEARHIDPNRQSSFTSNRWSPRTNHSSTAGGSTPLATSGSFRRPRVSTSSPVVPPQPGAVTFTDASFQSETSSSFAGSGAPPYASRTKTSGSLPYAPPPPLEEVDQLSGLLASWNSFAKELEREL